jgi:multiple sugar transport system permease protein
MDSINRKIKRQKAIKEFLTALAFLAPNFFGFLLITAFPIVAVFLLAITEWDGISYASRAEGEVQFVPVKTLEKDVFIPKGTEVKGEVVVEKKFTGRMKRELVGFSDIKLPKVGDDFVIPVEVKGGKEAFTYRFPEGSEFIVEIALYITNKVTNNGTVSEVVEITNAKVKFVNVSEFEVTTGTSIEIVGKIKEVVEGVYLEGASVPVENVTVRGVHKTIVKFNGLITESVTIPAGTKPIDINKVGMTTEGYFARVISAKPGEEFNLPEGKILAIEGFPEVEAVVSKAFINGKTGIKFVGLDNFKKLFTRDKDFWRYFINTLIFMLEVPLGMAFAIILALALNQKLKGITVFRVLYFLPYISNLVAVAMLWRWIYNDNGLLNDFLKSLGVINPPSWLGDGNWAKVAIIIMDIWKNVGYTMLVYLASLQQIPSYLYEAADIDGANGLQQFAYITWPMLGPTNFFLIIIGIINGFQAFGSQYVLTGGGPAGATKTIVYYIYNNAFQWFKMGYAAALSVFLFFVMMIFTIIQWKMGQESTTSSW